MFGFKVHVCASLARWQDGVRIEQRKGLREAGVEGVGFVEDGQEGDEEEALVVGDEAEGEREEDGKGGDGAMEVIKE